MDWDRLLVEITTSDGEKVSISPCKRCGLPCKGEVSQNPNARPFQKALTGYCAECVVTHLLQFDLHDVVTMAIAQHGKQIFLSEPCQKQFAKLLKTGNSELPFEKISWQRLVDCWEMPFAEERGKGRKRKGRN